MYSSMDETRFQIHAETRGAGSWKNTIRTTDCSCTRINTRYADHKLRSFLGPTRLGSAASLVFCALHTSCRPAQHRVEKSMTSYWLTRVDGARELVSYVRECYVVADSINTSS